MSIWQSKRFAMDLWWYQFAALSLQTLRRLNFQKYCLHPARSMAGFCDFRNDAVEGFVIITMIVDWVSLDRDLENLMEHKVKLGCQAWLTS